MIIGSVFLTGTSLSNQYLQDLSDLDHLINLVTEPSSCLLFSTEFPLTEEVMCIHRLYTIMATEDPIKLNFGAYLLQFDRSEYNIEMRDDIAIATAKDDPNSKARISILPSVSWTNLYEDTLQRVRTASQDFPWMIENIPPESRSPGPERIQVDGRDGFRVQNAYLGKDGTVILSAERVGCWLDDFVICEILAIYSPDDRGTVSLVRSIVKTIHFENS